MADIAQKDNVLTITLTADEMGAFSATESDPTNIVAVAINQVMNRAITIQFAATSDALRMGLLSGAITPTEAQATIQPLLDKISAAAPAQPPLVP